MLGIFLDTETNGLNPYRHKILELAFKIVDVDSGEVKESFQSLVSQPREQWELSDPESLKITGFTWEEISRAPTHFQLSKDIISLLKKWGIKRGSAVFICQNPSFDRIFFSQLIDPDIQEALLWPYHWLDLASMYWAVSIKTATALPWSTGISKDKISAIYKIPPEGKPHRAMNGVNHLLACYEAVVGFPHRQ